MAPLVYGTTITPGWDFDRAAYLQNLEAGYESGVAQEAARRIVPPTYTHQDNINFILSQYTSRFHRPADPGGRDFWVAQLENGSHQRSDFPDAMGVDQSPNSSQTLQAYLTGLGIAPLSGYTFAADGRSIVPISATTTTTTGTTTTTTGSGVTSLPLVGPIIGSIAESTGFSPTIVAIAGAALLAVLFGVVDLGGGGGARRRNPRKRNPRRRRR